MQPLLKQFASKHTESISVKRGTVQGDTLSPLLFLIYVEPLLRWLHVGGKGYEHDITLDKQPQPDLERLANRNISGAFADDLICQTCTKITDLRTKAEKPSLYSDWAALIVYGRRQK